MSDDFHGGGHDIGFFKHVFNCDSDGKAHMSNIVQYGILAIIPIVSLNKFISTYIPPADYDKSSIEILAEVLIQIIIMFLGIFIIHRIITWFSTYSGKPYDEMSITPIILSVLLIVLSIESRLGEKTTILYNRVFDLWSGAKPNKKAQVREGNTLMIQQPLSGSHMMPPMPQSAMSTSLSDLPPIQQNQQPMHQDNMGGIMPANEWTGGSGFGSSY